MLLEICKLGYYIGHIICEWKQKGELCDHEKDIFSFLDGDIKYEYVLMLFFFMEYK
jgi:hypothetical protein